MASRHGRVFDVFRTFLWLGCTSFGGPVAHLGYFHTEFVVRRRWLSEAAYAELVALCQFLPGPASSQVGFALGLLRAGPWGAAAAWVAFTLPSALLLALFALGSTALEGPLFERVIDSLKLVAVAVVAHAVWGMAKSLCPDRARAGIALGAVFVAALASGPAGQVGAIALGAVAGLWLCRSPSPRGEVNTFSFGVSRRAGAAALALFALLLGALPLLAPMALWLDMVDAFYRAGALVFGGGHVVLPLLSAETVQPGLISNDAFMTGYGAAQAIPGPLFTFAAYLGALWPGVNAGAGAALALVAIFAPGFLLLVGVLPFWHRFRRGERAQALLRGASAAVVGILGLALFDPVWVSAVLVPIDVALALTGFLLLSVWRLPAWAVVIIVLLGGIVLG
ncbi:chromate efflux transporter [Halomonas sp. PAMB 3232]|uniref:chromate efflux transporter n=1 Tax=Halomonas sp. PAMB 3232 TaxID=3075221 RepID=UPI0028A0C6A2|nr:chromate efflux transporter [Halomonas sp. PAMB 3232]WNL40028.1 chromate efflux transporter [Halomonas sp. PAMB 3232]